MTLQYLHTSRVQLFQTRIARCHVRRGKSRVSHCWVEVGSLRGVSGDYMHHVGPRVSLHSGRLGRDNVGDPASHMAVGRESCEVGAGARLVCDTYRPEGNHIHASELAHTHGSPDVSGPHHSALQAFSDTPYHGRTRSDPVVYMRDLDLFSEVCRPWWGSDFWVHIDHSDPRVSRGRRTGRPHTDLVVSGGSVFGYRKGGPCDQPVAPGLAFLDHESGLTGQPSHLDWRALPQFEE